MSIEETLISAPPPTLYRVVSTHNINNIEIDLVKWRPIQTSLDTTVVTVRSKPEFNQLVSKWTKLRQKQKLVVIASYPVVSELKDFVKEKRKDTDCNLYLIMVSENANLHRLPVMDLAYSVLNNVKYF